MSISSEITRIANAVAAIKQSITAKGTTVPSGTKVDGLAALIDTIQTGVDTSDATASAGDILSPKTAYGSSGSKLTGTIPTKSANDVTLSGPTTTIPAGYYASQVQKTMPYMVVGSTSYDAGQRYTYEDRLARYFSPRLSVKTAGYKNSTHDIFGNPALIFASDIVEGTLNITSEGETDCTNYAKVNVVVPHPVLNAPTISLAGSVITIINPATNGNFVSSYTIYDGDTTVATVSGTTVDLSNYSLSSGTHTITAKANGQYFDSSAASNSVTYTVSSGYNLTIDVQSSTHDNEGPLYLYIKLNSAPANANDYDIRIFAPDAYSDYENHGVDGPLSGGQYIGDDWNKVLAATDFYIWGEGHDYLDYYGLYYQPSGGSQHQNR